MQLCIYPLIQTLASPKIHLEVQVDLGALGILNFEVHAVLRHARTLQIWLRLLMSIFSLGPLAQQAMPMTVATLWKHQDTFQFGINWEHHALVILDMPWLSTHDP